MSPIARDRGSAGNATPLRANPQAALPLLSMIEKAQMSLLEDLLGRLSRQFVEQLLMIVAELVAGPKHPSRPVEEVGWHGHQGGPVNLGTSKLKITQPRVHGHERIRALINALRPASVQLQTAA